MIFRKGVGQDHPHDFCEGSLAQGESQEKGIPYHPFFVPPKNNSLNPKSKLPGRSNHQVLIRYNQPPAKPPIPTHLPPLPTTTPTIPTYHSRTFASVCLCRIFNQFISSTPQVNFFNSHRFSNEERANPPIVSRILT